MGPFPHSAPRATISPANPAGTDGFEFVEFAHPEPEKLREVFRRMGYECTARHKTRAIELCPDDATFKNNFGKIAALSERRGAATAKGAGLLGRLFRR